MEWVVGLTEGATESDMGRGAVEGDVGWDRGVVGFTMFGDDGPDGGEVFGIGVGAEFGVEVTGLEDAVGFMVAESGIDGANEGEVVHHGGLFGEVFADGYPWDIGLDGLKRSAVIEGSIGFGVPGIDVAWTAGHPEEDDTFGWLGRLLNG